MLRLTPAKWTGDQPKGKVPDPNWGPPKLDTFLKKSQKTEIKCKKYANKNNKKANKNNKKANEKQKTKGPSVGSSPGKWAPTFPKSSVWDLGWGAVPTTNPFLKIYVPIQVLMQGQKPKPN
jgi:hypothetical protein